MKKRRARDKDVVGWTLVHSRKKYPVGTTPRDDLEDNYCGPWHWKRSPAMVEGRKGVLLFCWQGVLFGHSRASVTRKISSKRRALGFNFAFMLDNYRHGRKDVRLNKISGLKHYHDLITLDDRMLKRYRQLSSD